VPVACEGFSDLQGVNNEIFPFETFYKTILDDVRYNLFNQAVILEEHT
jgi:hypothetical protein